MASCSQPPPPPPPPPPAMAIPSQPSDIELAKMLSALADPSATAAGNHSLIIHEADVYAQDPADLTRHFAPVVAEDGREAWYFSTKLEPKSRGGKRKRRCMESGVWHDEGKSKPVVVGSEGRVIGHRRLFVFKKRVDGAKKGAGTGWIMHEFRLPVPDGNEESLVVLCKVFRSSRAPNPAISATAAESQAQVEVELDEEEEALEAREAAVARREAAVARREAEVARREAAVARTDELARREAPDLAVSERNLQERQSNLAAREAALQPRLPALAAGRSLLMPPPDFDFGFGLIQAVREQEVEAWQRYGTPPTTLAPVLYTPMIILLSRAEFERRFAQAELAREAELREAECEGLATREAARLTAWERDLPELDYRNLTLCEQARQQELEAEFAAVMEVLVLMMAAARAGLLVPLLLIAGGSRAAVAHCGGALVEPLF